MKCTRHRQTTKKTRKHGQAINKTIFHSPHFKNPRRRGPPLKLNARLCFFGAIFLASQITRNIKRHSNPTPCLLVRPAVGSWARRAPSPPGPREPAARACGASARAGPAGQARRHLVVHPPCGVVDLSNSNWAGVGQPRRTLSERELAAKTTSTVFSRIVPGWQV